MLFHAGQAYCPGHRKQIKLTKMFRRRPGPIEGLRPYSIGFFYLPLKVQQVQGNVGPSALTLDLRTLS